MTITTRQTSAEGVVNKNSPLTNAEVDGNFIDLKQNKYEAGDSPDFAAVSADSVALDTDNVTLPTVAGTMAWSADDETVMLALSGGVPLPLGEKCIILAKADEAIAKGDVVYASSAIGNSGKIGVSKYIANNTIPSRMVIGIAAADIVSGEFGYVTAFGSVKQLDTTGSAVSETWTSGTILYASPTTAGKFTSTRPVAPNQDIAIAFVINAHANNGVLFVRAFELGQTLGDLHDVYTNGGVNDNDLLQYNSAAGRWEPVAVTTTDIAEGTNQYYTVTRANAAIDARVNKAFIDALGVAAASVPWTGVTGKPATFPPSTHTHAISDVTGLQTALNAKVAIADIINNLTSNNTDKPLSANQGLVLKNAIDNINAILASDDTTLDELQEIVDYIKQNRSDLDALGISNIAGLQAALDTKVDKITGKGLSTEDYTTAEKSKLAGIAAGAQVNVATNLGITGTGNTRTITSSTGTDVTVPVATTTTAGLMATGDKTKLDGIAAGAQVNVATNLSYSTATTTGTVNSSTGTNATIPAATTSLAGLMTNTDKSKLDGIAAGANNYSHPTYAGDDINLDTGPLTGATVISDLDFNVTTDTLGHVTDANATYSTRNLTAADVGAAAASHTHTIANVTGLQSALDGKAPLTGAGTSGTWGINITGNAATASSTTLLSDLNNYVWSASSLPTTFPEGIQCSFVSSSQGFQDFGSLMNMRTYSGGGGSLQLYVPYSSAYGGTGLQVRFGDYGVSSGNSWTAWKTLLASDNYNTYAPTLTGGGASGTWGINITGNAATVTNGVYTTGNQSIGGIKTFSAGRIDSSGAASHNHGSISIGGQKGSYAGIAFPDANAVFMVRASDALSGVYVNNNTWRWYFDGAGVLTQGTVPWARLSGIPTTFTPSAHTHSIANVTGLQGALDGKAPLTGAGTSGTWGINITGNAATATSADNIDGVGFRNTGSNSAVNADTLNSNGTTYYSSGVPNFSGNATDGALYSQVYSSSWQHQIAGDYRSGQIALRGKNNNTWQAWRTVLDSGNYNTYAPTLTGGGASGTWGISITGNAATATTATNQSGGAVNATSVTYGTIIGPATSSRDKIRVYSSSSYAIGMQSGVTYGGLNDWAMTFQFNNDSDRGFWWGHEAHTTAQGAMSLTTAGHLTVGARVDAPIFYDSNNTGFYVDPASTGTSANFAGNIQAAGTSGSSFYAIELARTNALWSSGSSLGLGTSSSNQVFTVQSSYTESVGSSRAPIFYDSNNTGYYVDPASTGTSINVAGDIITTGPSPFIVIQNTDEDACGIIFNDLQAGAYPGGSSQSFQMTWNAGTNLFAMGHDNDTDQFTLNTGGDLSVTGNITAYGSTSDISIKENIEAIDKAVDKVKQIRGITFNYIGDQNRMTGVVAQEVQKVLPEAVYDTDNDKLAVRYGNMVGLLIEAIKEQQTQIEALTSEINTLKEMIK